MQELNRIIKDFHQEPYFLYIENGSLLLETNKSFQVTTLAVLNVLRHETMYDELILVKASMHDFASMDEFVSSGLLKADVKKVDIASWRKEISEEEFNTVLDWGFLGVFEGQIENPILFKYTTFSMAYTYFETPQKPWFSAILDDSYFLFINNTYT